MQYKSHKLHVRKQAPLPINRQCQEKKDNGRVTYDMISYYCLVLFYRMDRFEVDDRLWFYHVGLPRRLLV